MVTVRDVMQMDIMKSLELIAGQSGLDKEITKVGILDFEFTRRGTTHSTEQLWQSGEFLLTSFLYAADNSDQLLGAAKRLCKRKSSGLAIRNVFQLEIGQDVIRYANQNQLPIFIINDLDLFFEDIIIEVDRLAERINSTAFQEKKIMEILYGSYDKETIKKLALEVNYSFSNSYFICYIKPDNELGQQHLEHLLRQGIGKKLQNAGDSLIGYKGGAFFIHTMNQYKTQQYDKTEYPFVKLGLDPSDYQIGLSEHQYHLYQFKNALLQSYYACYHAELYQAGLSRFGNIGIYQLLFHSLQDSWKNVYLNRIYQPLEEYDSKTKNNLWDTLLEYEKHNGNIKETAQTMFTHENTIRYRIKKVYDLFERDVNDKNFETELLVAVKLYRMQLLEQSDPNLFA